MTPYEQLWNNIDYAGARSKEAIDAGAPVIPVEGGLVANATDTATKVWISKQAATATGDTSYFQNHITPTMKVGDPHDCTIYGARTAKLYGAVTFGCDLIVDTTNKAFKAAGVGNTAPVVGRALCTSDATEVHYGMVELY